MTRDDVLAILRAHRDELAAMGVTGLRLFDSFARDEAGQDSDVDMLVDIDPNARVGIWGFAGIKMRLEELLGRKVDLIEPPMLREHVKKTAVRDLVDAF